MMYRRYQIPSGNVFRAKRNHAPPNGMHPEVHDVWLAFKNGNIDLEGARIRLDLIKPLLRAKYPS
jgi:hypothetical protein